MSALVGAVILGGVVLGACGSSSTPTTSTSTTTTVITSQPATAIWPFYQSGVRYTTPEAAASSFASQYVGIPSPTVGAFQRINNRSGFVSIQPHGGGPITTVYVSRVVGGDSWWVLRSSTPNIVVSNPLNGGLAKSPLTVVGNSTAFEAVVNLYIRIDGASNPISTETVMGGSNGVMGPFHKAITFGPTVATAGAFVFAVRDAKDGNIIEATVVRVRY